MVAKKKRNYKTSVQITEASVVKDSVRYPEGAHVYFLLKQSRIQYIGSSCAVFTRIGAHRALGEIPFDAYHIIACPAGRLLEFEGQMIERFQPPYNIMVPRFGGRSSRLKRTLVHTPIAKGVDYGIDD